MFGYFSIAAFYSPPFSWTFCLSIYFLRFVHSIRIGFTPFKLSFVCYFHAKSDLRFCLWLQALYCFSFFLLILFLPFWHMNVGNVARKWQQSYLNMYTHMWSDGKKRKKNYEWMNISKLASTHSSTHRMLIKSCFTNESQVFFV